MHKFNKWTCLLENILTQAYSLWKTYTTDAWYLTTNWSRIKITQSFSIWLQHFHCRSITTLKQFNYAFSVCCLNEVRRISHSTVEIPWLTHRTMKFNYKRKMEWPIKCTRSTIIRCNIKSLKMNAKYFRTST